MELLQRGLCGTWKGSWQRYSVNANGELVPGELLCATCKPMLSADGLSVHHVNRYEPGTAPPGPPGRLVDGLHEVDFGQFNHSNFRNPFGPHSLAIYMDGAAVIGSKSLVDAPRGTIAVEFVSVHKCRRRRLVALWRRDMALEEPSQSSMTMHRLAGVTAIEETNTATAALTTPTSVGDLRVSRATGYRTETQANGSVITEDASCTSGDATDAGLHGGICAWLPRTLSPPKTGDKVEMCMGWLRNDHELLRVCASYSEGALVGACSDIFKVGADSNDRTR